MQPHEKIENSSDLTYLQEELESKYGPAVAQDIIDRLNKTPQKSAAKAPDYMDVKAMSELTERHRAAAMMIVWKLKEFRKSQNKINAPKNITQLEGAQLTRQCQDAISLYRLSHQTYFQMYRDALAAFSVPSSPFAYVEGRYA